MLKIQDGLEAVPSDAALCLFRLTQEALRNVVKHSGAMRAEVTLSGSRESLELCVADRGRGFDRKQAAVVCGLGLRRIRNTVEVPDTPEMRGMILKVRHLVEVIE